MNLHLQFLQEGFLYVSADLTEVPNPSGTHTFLLLLASPTFLHSLTTLCFPGDLSARTHYSKTEVFLIEFF